MFVEELRTFIVVISQNRSNRFCQVKFMMLTKCFLILAFQAWGFFDMLSQNLTCSLVWGRRADTQSFTVFPTSNKLMHRRASWKYKSTFLSCDNIKQSWLFHIILDPRQRLSTILFSFLHVRTAQILSLSFGIVHCNLCDLLFFVSILYFSLLNLY